METYEIGQIFEENPTTGEMYPTGAVDWCNNGGVAHIEEIDPITKEVAEEYECTDKNGNMATKTRMVKKTLRRFQIVANPEPTIEEKQDAVRDARNAYLVQYVDPIVTNPLRWADLTTEQQDQYKAYRQYLLDYPESSEDWYEQNPMTFDEWLARQ